MFLNESGYQFERRRGDTAKAIAYYADINEHTRLYSIDEGAHPRGVNDPKPTRKEKLKTQEIAQPKLFIARTLFDFNEHFIELSNGEENKRSLGFMLAILFELGIGFPLQMAVSLLFESAPVWVACVVLSFSLAVIALVYFLFWPHVLAPAFFTALRARYRFNRTTRKVYVLRPKKYGGNAVLDWDRVEAHVKWAPPKSWTAEELASSEEARRDRLLSAGIDSNLLLYWPPLDPTDPERKGEDVIWVGPNGSGEPLWQYIRTFMEDGMQAVPQPSEYNWLRKGFSSPGQHMEETVMHGSLVRDKIVGEGTSGATAANFGLNVLWAPLHTLAERLCYWPTFPEEWNSDCGQKRRESGIGPEEPLRWVAKV